MKHLHQWRNMANVVSCNKCEWVKGEERLVAAKMVELFHLFVDSSKFLDALVPLVLQLEHVWCEGCEKYSPFRGPLAMVASKSVDKMVEIFKKHLPGTEEADDQAFDLFLGVLKCDAAHEVLDNRLQSSSPQLSSP